ncbi:hypothetical protein HNR73_007285 [Phytomonospora endophytica]|uniref:Uncharacterized protein n=1 Tax=Phytomonospora endophytica TaxID=714109 RepID=A0A841G5L6_9ACTN|nr:hypothetical protein [Phytomonospora endophytica]
MEFLAAHDFTVTAGPREHALRTYTRVTTPGDNEWYDL